MQFTNTLNTWLNRIWNNGNFIPDEEFSSPFGGLVISLNDSIKKAVTTAEYSAA